MKVEIDKNAPLMPGDVIEMHVNRFGQSTTDFDWAEMAYLAIIEWRLKSNSVYEIISSQMLPGEVVYTIRIQDQGPQVQQASIAQL